MDKTTSLVDQLRAKNPVLASLFGALVASPTGEALDKWVYDQTYAQLGELLHEWHPLMEGCEMIGEPYEGDGHNGFEEFVIAVLTHHMGKHYVWDGKNFRPDQLTYFIEAWVALEGGIDDMNEILDRMCYRWEHPEEAD